MDASSRRYFDALKAKAYWELHIEQGPVLQELKWPVGVVVGTMGVERHLGARGRGCRRALARRRGAGQPPAR